MADIREQTPISNKASAGVKHMGDGMKMAIAFVKEFTEAAKLEVKVAANMKGKLEKLSKLTVEELNGFTAGLNDKRKEIEAEAKEHGYDTVTNYYQSGTTAGSVANSINVSISLWVKIASALANNWKPDTKKPWAVLSKEATQYKRAATTDSAGKPLSDTEKQAQRVKEQQALVQRMERQVESTMVEKDGDKIVGLSDIGKSVLPDVVASAVKWATVEEVEACIKRLQDIRDAMLKAREEVKRAVGVAKKQAEKEAEAETRNPGQQQQAEGKAMAQKLPRTSGAKKRSDRTERARAH